MKTYNAELEKLLAKQKRQLDDLKRTEEVAQALEDAKDSIPEADSPDLSWSHMFGYWQLSSWPLETPRVTEALKILVAGGFRVSDPFPKELDTDFASCVLRHRDLGVRVDFLLHFGKSTTCRLEPTGEVEERSPRQKMRLVCDSPTGRRIAMPQVHQLEGETQ